MSRKKTMPQKLHESDANINSEILFNQLLQISADGLRLMNEDGQVLRVNDSYCRLVGKTKDELEGQHFTNSYYHEDRSKILDTYQSQVRNKNLPAHSEGRYRLWDGRTIWFEFSNSLLEIPGAGHFVLSILKDITPRKEAEIELAASEDRFRLLFNNANDAVFVISISEDTKLERFIEINRIACERLMFSKEEFMTLNPYSIVPQEYYDFINIKLEELTLQNHAIFRLESLRRDKRRIPVEISALLFEFKNKPTVLFIARDITKRTEVERQLKDTGARLRNLAARQQAVREEERTLIAREIHDELGQMLTVSKIQLSLLVNKLFPGQEEMKEKFKPIMQLIDQAVDSVQQISAKLRPGILDELGLVAAIEWQTKDFEERTGITFRSSLLKYELNLSKDKATAIFRIYQEALTNVARHAQAERVSTFLRRENGLLILEVIDNGRGISKGQLEDQRSLGILGMKERAMILGGTVTINGVPGQGTSLKVEMPMDENME